MSNEERLPRKGRVMNERIDGYTCAAVVEILPHWHAGVVWHLQRGLCNGVETRPVPCTCHGRSKICGTGGGKAVHSLMLRVPASRKKKGKVHETLGNERVVESLVAYNQRSSFEVTRREEYRDCERRRKCK